MAPQRITGQENSLPAMEKPQFIQELEFESDREDSMPTPPVVSFKKVPHVGFGRMVLILLQLLEFHYEVFYYTVGVFESVIHAKEASDELFRIKA